MIQIKNFILVITIIFSNISFAADIKAIIFDCDGTLVDNGRGYFLDWHYALQCQGYELDEQEFWHFMDANQLVGLPGAETIIALYYCELLGRDCVHELLSDVFLLHTTLKREFPPIDATVAFLHQLAAEKDRLGIRIGLASGGTKEHILRTLNSLGVAECFDVIVSGHDDLTIYHDSEGTNKPKPYVYMHAAKMLGFSPEQCVAIEDTRIGIASAVNAGCIAVAIPNDYTRKQDFSRADLIIKSLAEISPTDFFTIIAELQKKLSKGDESLFYAY